jgi:hypothetical protein
MIALGAAAYAPLPSMAQSSVHVVMGSAPPAPLYERVPAPRRGYVWAPGYWEWTGHRHRWVRGDWLEARPGYVYEAPSWHRRGDRWYLEPGGWDRGRDRHMAYSDRERRAVDRDRDGIPDYRDDYIRSHGGGRGGDVDYGDGQRDHDRGRVIDRDEDGIPDDRDNYIRTEDTYGDRDGDGILNHADRDRDGDGVPNRRDDYPNNPYRR